MPEAAAIPDNLRHGAANPRRTPGATRQAEHRQREREGVLRCVYVPIHPAVVEALIDRGLSPEEALDPKAVGRELGDVLMQWAARWRREKNFP